MGIFKSSGISLMFFLLFMFSYVNKSFALPPSCIYSYSLPTCPCDPFTMTPGTGGSTCHPLATTSTWNTPLFYWITNSSYILNPGDMFPTTFTNPNILYQQTNYDSSPFQYKFYNADQPCKGVPSTNLPCGQTYNIYFLNGVASGNATVVNFITVTIPCNYLYSPTLTLPNFACVNTPVCATFTLDQGGIFSPAYTLPPTPPMGNPSVDFGNGTIITYSNGFWYDQNGNQANVTSVGTSGYSFSYCTTYSTLGTKTVTVRQPGLCSTSIGTRSRTINISGPRLTTTYTSQCGGIVNFATTLQCPCINPIYSWNFGDGSPVVTGGANISHTYTSALAYTVTVTACGTSSTRSIPASNIKLNPTVTVNSPSICFGQSATLTASSSITGTTYLWSPGGATTNSITVSPTTTTVYTLIGTSANGCSGQAISTVTVNPLPTITVNSQTICSGQSATLTAIGGTAGTTYLWSPGGATTSSITVSPTVTTNYTVTGTNTSGCSKVVTSTVSVKASPIITVNSTSICRGQSATLTASSSITGTTYVWSPGGATTSSITVSPIGTTNYTVVGTSPSSCSGQAISNVTVNPLPKIKVNSPTICAGESAMITASSGNVSNTFLWSPGGATTSSITVSPTVTTNYIVTVTNINGCSNQATSTVTVNPLPVVDATAFPSVICAGQSSVLTATGATTYVWSLNGITIGTGTTITVNPLQNETYTVTGTTNGCSSTGQVSVTQGSITVDAGPDLLSCTVPITLSAVGATDYNWSINGTTIGTGSSLDVSPDTVTTYVVIGSIGGCMDADTVTVNPHPITVEKFQSLGTRPTSAAYTFQNVNYEIKICNGTASDQTVTVTDFLPSTFVFDQIVYGATATNASFMPTITSTSFTGNMVVPANSCVSIFYNGKYQTFGSEQTACIPQDPNVVEVTDPVCGGTITAKTDLCISFGCPGHLSISTCDCLAPVDSSPDVTMWYNQHKLYEDVTKIEYIVHYPNFLELMTPIDGGTNYSNHFPSSVNGTRSISIGTPSASTPGYLKSTVTANFGATDIGTSVPSVFNIKFNVIAPINALPTNSYPLFVENPYTNSPSYTRLTTTASGTTSTYDVLTQIAVLQLTGSCWDTLVPDSDFTFTVDNCTGQVNCSATNTESGFHRWEFNDPNQPFVPIWGSGNISNTYVSSGTYTVSHLFVNQDGISSTSTHQITISEIYDTKVDFNFNYGTNCVVNFDPTITASAGTTIIGWSWDFGDAASGSNNISNLQFPSHYFNGTGAYNVCLTVTALNGSDTCTFTTCKSLEIKCPCEIHGVFEYKFQDCQAQFFGFADSPNGTNITYAWDFGNPASGSNNTSNLQNPIHNFTGSGSYYVCLTVTSVNKKVICTDTYCKYVKVECPKCEVKSDFKYTIGKKCEAIFGGFASLGTGTSIVGWNWNFGDPASGAGNYSNLQNPTHFFSGTGSYKVCLTVTAVAGVDTCKTDICYEVNIECPKCEVFPKFEFKTDKCNTFFSDLSYASGTIIGWSWNFNDPASGVNNTSSLQNPMHTFTTSGAYKVCLIVTAVVGLETCKYEICQEVKVDCPCSLKGDFKFSVKSCKVSFADLSATPGTLTNWSWDFGDPNSGASNTSTAQNPTHAFSGSGSYNVCLTVTSVEKELVCSYTICKSVVVSCSNLPKSMSAAKLITDNISTALDIYPNPSNQETTVSLSTIENGMINVGVYNMFGELIATLYQGTAEGGTIMKLKWDASSVASGIYIIKVDLGTEVLQKRMLVTK